MASIRSIIQCILLLTLTRPSISTEANDQDQETQVDQDAFQHLLAQVDPPALHAALHDFSPRKFAHGMFPEDRTAVEAIHREEPDIATGILKMAKLGKRQVANGTLTTSTSPPESQVPATTRVAPVPQGSETSSSAVESFQSTLATQTSSPAVNSPTPTSSGSASLTAGQVVTTTNAAGLTIVSTVGGGATTLSPSASSSSGPVQGPSSITSTLLHTSTLPNGDQSTITAITVVAPSAGAETPSGTAGAGAGKTTSGQPGLQTGEAAMTRGCGKEMVVVLGAAVGVAFML
ncbi:uncharacterized protein KY384_008198 [Bacidia gigantensis]|uniref:uncharacterized protein n=1 Tax=Bacidia gigantensis TaxID=2732470 RepID=UPI001D046826|nr:uncharacterized protein KY384_008198 [Bacidia gigantensis]KAG8526769.1 hypothetical protein KY384_008198 [Bacidia gigantensis]